MAVRKRCKHAHGLTGRAKVKAWRACECAWGVDLYIRGVRTWHNLGADEAAAKVAELRLRADNAEQRVVRRRPGDTVEEVLDAWLTHKISAGAKVASIANYQSHIRRLTEYFAGASVDIITTDTVRRLSDDLRAAGLGPRSVNYQHTGGGFMGRSWDSFVPGPAVWSECLRVLKPGGHLLAFFGTRTADIGGLAIRLAGFDIRDTIAWMYGSGFPKSLDASKAIDASLGVDTKADERWVPTPHFVTGENKTATGASEKISQASPGVRCLYSAQSEEANAWAGWGTALKPAFEPVIVARRPLVGTVAANVLEHGTGAINIDACRVGDEGGTRGVTPGGSTVNAYGNGLNGGFGQPVPGLGRWPANVTLDEAAAEVLDAQTREIVGGSRREGVRTGLGYHGADGDGGPAIEGSAGGASRFFYTSKAGSGERLGSKHPTVKPVDLMRWLVRLVTPPGGVVLDPFAGTGTTGQAAIEEGFPAILVEREAEYLPDIRRRLVGWGATEGTLLDGVAS